MTYFSRDSDEKDIILTQQSLNCLASIGEVKFKPQVSLVIGSFQYTKHSDAWPILVPVKNKEIIEAKQNVNQFFGDFRRIGPFWKILFWYDTFNSEWILDLV